MTRHTQRLARAVQTCNRRQALAGGASLLAAGGAVLAVGSGPARARVAVDGLAIPDASLTGATVTPVADVSVDYAYDAGDQPVGALQFALAVDGDEIAGTELVTDQRSHDGTTTLSGRLTDSDAWAAADFAPPVGGSVERTLTVGVAFDVVADDSSRIVGDSATETVTVVVEHPQDHERTASVAGDGTIRTATPTT